MPWSPVYGIEEIIDFSPMATTEKIPLMENISTLYSYLPVLFQDLIPKNPKFPKKESSKVPLEFPEDRQGWTFQSSHKFQLDLGLVGLSSLFGLAS